MDFACRPRWKLWSPTAFRFSKWERRPTYWGRISGVIARLHGGLLVAWFRCGMILGCFLNKPKARRAQNGAKY
jgi:hypothetical protein